jgi:hypothetical protein
MKRNETVKISIIAAILIIAISVAHYFVFLLPKSNTTTNSNTIGNTLKCNQLYELKKSKYWGNDIGQSKAIYNSKLDTCLALNIYNDFDTEKYFAMIIDMSDDSTLMYYSANPQGFYVEGDEKITCQDNYIFFEFVQNGKENKEYGCDSDEKGTLTDEFDLFDKMFEKVRDFDFKVFDGFSPK